MKVSGLSSIRIKIASPEDILNWSKGEVKKPETINYRTQRPEKDGLFCERIFGPSKDFECYCGKYKGIRYKGIVCDRCSVEVIRSSVRRERMGHIKLAAPVSHIWFLKGIPSRMGLVLDVPQQRLEKVIYFAGYIVEKVDEKAQKKLLEELEEEGKTKLKRVSKEELSQKEKNKKTEGLKSNISRIKEKISLITPLAILSEVEYRELASKYGEIFEADTGAETLLRIFKKIDLKAGIENLKKELEKGVGEKKKILRRLRLFQKMQESNIRPEWMFLTVLPVLPADLRPMVQLDGGRYASSDLNDLYRRVINRNNRLKYLIEISAPEVIVRNEKRMLQEAVDSMLDNGMRKTQVTTASTGGKRVLKSLADILSGKQGRFRRNLLGKRVDYSARSVIAPGSELKLFQCGIPKIMALELFRPFIIKKLLDDGLVFNIRGASRLIDEARPEVFAALEEVVKGKLVLLNRAPTLHRLGIQAFQPVLVEGEALKIHPLVCKAFNADFDGDQMAVHLPLSDEAQREAQDLMLSSKNMLKPATGTPIISPTQDIVLGCYYLTGEKSGALGEGKIFSGSEEAILVEQLGKIDLQAKIKIYSLFDKKELFETTCGRVIFNQVLPENFPFINERVDSKKLSGIVGEIIAAYPSEEVQKTLDRIKEIGFEYATLSGISLGMDDFIVPKEKPEILKAAEKEIEIIEGQYRKGLLSKDERNSKIIEIWQEVKEKLEKLVKTSLPQEGPVFSIVNSGARGSWAQPVQICGMKGLVTSPSGRIIELPIKNSFKEGFDVLEFFISTHGARKGTVDTALRTSASGYLTRRLVDVSHEIIVSQDDCGDEEGVEIFREDADKIGQDFVFKIVGRISLEDIKAPFPGAKEKTTIVKKGEIIDWKEAKLIRDLKIEKVRARSPLACKSSRGICQKCYGWEMGRNKLASLGDAVGIIASQSIGEPGTQLTMRTFHMGGVAGKTDITRGLPRVEEIFELRGLKGEGAISLVEGKVKEIDEEKGIMIISAVSGKKSQKNQNVEYKIQPDSEIYVKKDQKVVVGQVLSSGPLDLKKLFKARGTYNTQRYILAEVQRIYVSEGIDIHDKHLEIIVRQMFSRVRITDEGDSPWVKGEVAGFSEIQRMNLELKKGKKNPVKFQPTLLGISRVALTSESFLSAASFQETSRILIKASLEGRRDRLLGLKENVIIGRLIPAGTGFKKKE